MTGFGSASACQGGAQFAVEIRSVNNRYLKCHVRAPDPLQGIEAAIEKLIAGRLGRGSVTVTLRWSDQTADGAGRLNTAALARYIAELEELAKAARPDRIRIDLGALATLPGVVITDTDEERLKASRETMLELVAQACDAVEQMRVHEGETLRVDLMSHLETIQSHLREIATRAPDVVEGYQKRLRQRMESLLQEVGRAVEEHDLLREVAVFAERADIAEEISRLQGHVDQFKAIMADDDNQLAGRTLDFLAQEMLREANTIGSKCLDGEISRRIVEAKGAIDRVKEQVQNIQ
jgi:uncharacterized protein (TIGR00255 family)